MLYYLLIVYISIYLLSILNNETIWSQGEYWNIKGNSANVCPKYKFHISSWIVCSMEMIVQIRLQKFRREVNLENYIFMQIRLFCFRKSWKQSNQKQNIILQFIGRHFARINKSEQFMQCHLGKSVHFNTLNYPICLRQYMHENGVFNALVGLKYWAPC